MEQYDAHLADLVLRTMAETHPKPVHFGYLSLAAGVNSLAMLQVLKQLRRDGLITVERSLASADIPYAQTRITAKGLVRSANPAVQAADETAVQRKAEALTLDRLLPQRAGGAAARLHSVVIGESARPCP